MSLRLPAKSDNLVEWSKELVEECYVSREERRDQIGSWIAYYYMGRADGQQARYNRIFSHIDRLASMLFSPVDVRFGLEYDETEGEAIIKQGQAAGRYLNREFHRCGIDMDFSQGVNTALVKGSMMLKIIWGSDGLEGWLVHPEQFGVLREDINDLDRQEAFVHTSWLTKSQFARTIIDHPDRKELLDRVDKEAKPGKELEIQQSFFHQVIIGGTNPPVGLGQATGSTGQVAIVSIPSPVLHQHTAARLIRQDELWVLDRERDDYTTIKLVGDILVEGKYRRKNLSGIKGEQPFHQICPNQVDGYFWGQSEVGQIYRLQDLLNDQLLDLTRLTRLKADPPRAAVGFSGLTQERYKVLKRPGGFVTEENPNAKIQSLAEDVPQSLFEAIGKTVEYFDDVAGFAPILMGQGDTGVRSSAQTSTLSRNASPRLRDRALLCERQVTSVGEFCLKMLAAKDAEIKLTEDRQEFLLSQLPDGYHVAVDLHTASPVFMEDAERKAVTLARLGAIDAEDVIRLTHPPHEDSLILRAKQRAEAQAKMMREHPELLAKGKGKK
jgi:hypothetical protein